MPVTEAGGEGDDLTERQPLGSSVKGGARALPKHGKAVVSGGCWMLKGEFKASRELAATASCAALPSFPARPRVQAQVTTHAVW